MSSIPTTWPELHAHLQVRNEEDQRSLATRAVARMQKRIPQTPMGRLFIGAAENLSRIAILVGPEACRPIVAAHAPFFAVAVEEAARIGTPGASPLIQLTLLSYGNVVRCSGAASGALSIDELAMVERIVRGKDELGEFEQEELAAACVVVGAPQRAMEVLEHDTWPAFKPGVKFDANIAGLLDYLCAALASGAPASDVQAAWHDLHALFPWKLSAETITWSTLLWIARAVVGRIGGAPDAEIAGIVHAMSSRP
jgi:hypothetical protein